MCMVCVDEALVAVGVVVAAAPWYRTLWQRINCKWWGAR